VRSFFCGPEASNIMWCQKKELSCVHGVSFSTRKPDLGKFCESVSIVRGFIGRVENPTGKKAPFLPSKLPTLITKSETPQRA